MKEFVKKRVLISLTVHFPVVNNFYELFFLNPQKGPLFKRNQQYLNFKIFVFQIGQNLKIMPASSCMNTKYGAPCSN